MKIEKAKLSLLQARALVCLC